MLATRLGLNVHRDRWPTAADLGALAEPGFGWVQVHSPPAAMLADRERTLRHARALREVLDGHALRLVLHGPDALTAGTPEADRALAGLLDHARAAGAERVVYHGLNLPLDEHDRAEAEERSLRRAAARAEALGLTLAVENLAPVHPGPARMCHDPLAVRDLVRRIGSPAVGMLLDVGHAHITTALGGGDLAGALELVAGDVVLFHVHDNLGARHHDLGRPGVDPLKLDLHLPPGAGTLPWDRVAPRLRDHPAPLMLEVERSYVPEAAALLAETTALLGRGVALAA
jgi:sugar phosphate isomerase/epimerase